MDETDAELLQRFARKGDREALGRLFTRHAPEAYRTARLILRDPGAAEDAVQEAFSRLITQASKHDPARPFLPWLRGFVAHAALQGLRSERSRSGREAAFRAERAPEDPVMRLIDSETLERLRGEIDALPEDLRLPVALHYQAGYSYVETAEALGCPEGTVATRLATARERLKTALAASGVILAAGVSLEDAAAASAPPVGPVPTTLSAVLQALAASAKLPPGSPASSPLSVKPWVLAAAGILVLGFLGWRAVRESDPTRQPPVPPPVARSTPRRAEGDTGNVPAAPTRPGTAVPGAALSAAPHQRCVLRGRVISKETGLPVPGAAIRAVAGPMNVKRNPEISVEARSDAEGGFRLETQDEIWDQERASELHVHAPGYWRCANLDGAEAHFAPMGDGVFDFLLEREYGLRVRLVTPDGSIPRRGSIELAGGALRQSATLGDDDPDEDEAGLLPRPDGWMEMVRLDPAFVRERKRVLRVRAEGWLPAEAILEGIPSLDVRQEVMVYLERGLTYAGVVLGPGGLPCAAVVYAWPARMTPDEAAGAGQLRTANADKAGRYSLAGIAPSEAVRLWARGVPRSNAAMASFLEIPPGGAAPGVLRLDAAGEVSGRVLDPNGAPVPGADVRACFQGPEGVLEPLNCRYTTAGADGAFTLKGLPAWTGLTVESWHPRRGSCAFGWTDVPVGTQGLEIVVKACDHPETYCPDRFRVFGR